MRTASGSDSAGIRAAIVGLTVVVSVVGHGVAATPVRALRTESALEGAPWAGAPVVHAAEVLGSEGTPISDYTTPSTGRYSLSLPSGATYRLTVEPQYAGYLTTTKEVTVGTANVTANIAVQANPEACTTAPGYTVSSDGEYETFDGTGVPDDLQRYVGGTWQYWSGSYAEDYDGWHSSVDRAAGGLVGCGNGNSYTVRAVVHQKWQGPSAGAGNHFLPLFTTLLISF